MKKRVEADLISIAHRILKLKNKSEVDILQVEIKKLYDAITILKFYNDNFEQVKATVLQEDLNDKLVDFLDFKADDVNDVVEIDGNLKPDEVAEPTVALVEVADIETQTEPATVETVDEEQEKTSTFEPLFEMISESLFEPVASSSQEISFEDLIGKNYDEPDFVKPSQLEQEKKQLLFEKSMPGVNISLNDRIGFEQHLFAGSSEDFNRVLSQLTTFDSFDEAKDFIDEIVKPDYDNWVGKDDFSSRFMEFVENKFK